MPKFSQAGQAKSKLKIYESIMPPGCQMTKKKSYLSFPYVMRSKA